MYESNPTTNHAWGVSFQLENQINKRLLLLTSQEIPTQQTGLEEWAYA
jgi:hypothetical protein